jgi:hypothetical protein
MKFVVPRIPIGVPATIPITSPLRTSRSSSKRFSASAARPSIFLMSDILREVTPHYATIGTSGR